MPIASHLLVFILLTAVPLWDLWDARRLRRSGGGREATYVVITIVLWALASCVLWLEPLDELVASPGGAWLPSSMSAVLTSAVLMVLLLPVVAAAVHGRTRDKVVAASAESSHLLPRTRREMALFAAMSVTAGICEELIFRAFLLHYFMTDPFGLPAPLSVGLAALAFGLAHVGQGWRGVGTATAAALVFSGLFHATGTLLVPVLVHVVVDLRVVAFARHAREAREAEGPFPALAAPSSRRPDESHTTDRGQPH